QYIESDQLIIKSRRLANEFTTFTVEGNKPQAAKGYNDDLIMSLSITLWIREVCPDLGYSVGNRAMYSNLYDSMKVNRRENPNIFEPKRKVNEVDYQKHTLTHGNIVIDIRGLLGK